MAEPERWIELSEVPSIADERWLEEVHEGMNGPKPAPEEEDSWKPINLADLGDTPPVEPTLGGLSLVYPGKRHVFSGPQESAKTLAAYVIGLQVVRSGERVVLIDFEMGPWDAKNRLRELEASDEDLASFLYVAPESPATADAVTRLVDLAPALVLVDAAAGAYDLQELDDNKRGDVERFTRFYVNGFWKAGIATIVLDHVTKNVEGRGKYAIGSERKVGGADVHLGFEVVTPIKRGGHGLYKIVTHKDRGGFLKRGKLAEFELQSDPDTHLISWAFKQPVETDEEHPFRPTGLMEKVSRWLEIQQEPVSRNAVESAQLGKRDYVRLALDLLTQEGFVEETKGANRARLVESLEAYREASDDTPSGSPQVRPEFAPESGNPSSPVRPSPYGGAYGERFAPEGAPGSPQGSSEKDDELPF
jgi:hypothetical protein